MKLDLKRVVVCIVGLGYVGLPLAEAFAKSLEVIGFDINDNRIRKLNRSNNNPNLTFTDNSREISGADFIMMGLNTTDVLDAAVTKWTFIDIHQA